MITLHRLGHTVDAFQLNPDLIMTVEANPDTVITLTTGTKIVVAEEPDTVARRVQEYRVTIATGVLRRARETRALQPVDSRTVPLRRAPDQAAGG